MARDSTVTGPRTVPRLLELSCYGLVAMVAVLPALLRPYGVVGDHVDLYGTLWFYWWIQDCLLNLRDPGFTTLFFHPLGKDIFAHTGNNFLDAALSIPFQWILGAPTWQPVFVAAVMIGNALTFRPLAARMAGAGTSETGWLALATGRGRLTHGAFLATILWQSSPYILMELASGRSTQALLWFLPLAVERFLAMEDAAEGPGAWKPALQAGVLLGLQALTYWFMGYFIAIFLLWPALTALHRARGRRWRLLGLQATAAGAALLLVAPFMLAMVARVGAGAVPGLGGDSSNLLSLPPHLANNLGSSFHGLWLMERWASPLLGHATWIAALVLVAAWGPDRRRWLVAMALAILFALGPMIPLGEPSPGQGSLRNIPYLLAYNLLPFLDRLWFPYRMVVMVHLAIAMCAGAALGRLLTARHLSPRLLLPLVLGLATLNLVEQARWGQWPLVNRDMEPSEVYSHLAAAGGGVIHLPIGMSQPSIVWQTVHRQPMFGGMGENASVLWPPGYEDRLRIKLIRFLRRVVIQPDPEAVRLPPGDAGRQGLMSEGFRWVILHADLVDSQFQRNHGHLVPPGEQPPTSRPSRVATRISELLGPPVAEDGPMVVWDLAGGPDVVFPPHLAPCDAPLSTRSWRPHGPTSYEQVLISRGRMEDRTGHPSSR